MATVPNPAHQSRVRAWLAAVVSTRKGRSPSRRRPGRGASRSCVDLRLLRGPEAVRGVQRAGHSPDRALHGEHRPPPSGQPSSPSSAASSSSAGAIALALGLGARLAGACAVRRHGDGDDHRHLGPRAPSGEDAVRLRVERGARCARARRSSAWAPADSAWTRSSNAAWRRTGERPREPRSFRGVSILLPGFWQSLFGTF